jgi:hypothetical protein
MKVLVYSFLWMKMKHQGIIKQLKKLNIVIEARVEKAAKDFLLALPTTGKLLK